MSKLPDREEFFNQLNTQFRIYFNEENPTNVELTEVSEIVQRGQFESFALIFSVPKNIPLQTLTFRIEHDAFDPMDLFMGPVGENADSYLFEAVFNQPIYASND